MSPTDKDLHELDELLTELDRRKHYNKLDFAFPDEGPLSRDHYPGQIAFFAAGKDYKERAIVAGNRTGKTFAAMYEVAVHATGLYPKWWTGYRFKHPVSIWCVGKSNESTKDILQLELIGSIVDKGSGLIPKDMLLSTTNRPGVPEAIQTARIRHFTDGIEDGISDIGFKSYEQGRDALQGTAINVVSIDEEPKDYGIYEELLTRTVKCRHCQDPKCRGRVIATFTPLFGVSQVVTQFLPAGQFPPNHVHPETKKWVCQLNLLDAPHMDQNTKDEFINGIAPWMRDARIRGIPQLGSGQIYRVPEADITVEPFPIPADWPRVYGLDVGWEKTAVVWMAQNPADNVWYIYSEHYVDRQEAPLHVEAIKSRGVWIPGVADPAANRSRDDGTTLFNQYVELGLNLRLARNTIEAGLSMVWQMMSCGQLKVFSSCRNWFMEFRMYHKDEHGKIPDRQPDHLMDATRYCVMSGLQIAITNPMLDEDDFEDNWFTRRPDAGASEVTGY